MKNKENNLGDTNKLYFTLDEVDSFLLENCTMGQKVGSFYGMKNQEQGKEKLNVSNWLELQSQLWGEKV